MAGYNVELIVQGRRVQRGYRLCAGQCGNTITIRGGKLYCAECSEVRRIASMRKYNCKRKPR